MKEYTLKELAAFKYGQIIKPSEFGKYPVFSGYRVTGFTDKYNCEKGNVVLVARGVGGTGDVKMIKTDSWVTNLSIILKTQQELLKPLYFYYYTKHNTLYALDSGSAQSQITISDLEKFVVSIPKLEVQDAIAEVLSSLDDKIDLLHRNNKTLEEMAGALFKSLIRDSSNESITSVLLHQIADINPETINSKFRNEHSEIEYLDTGSVTKGQINGFQTISIDKAPSRAQRVVRKGDIIYSLVRPVQRHYALLDEVKANSIASTGFAVIRPKVNCQFIYQLLTSDESVEFLDMIAEASTSTYPSLKPSDIANFETALPGEEALEQFHQQAELMQEKVNKNYRQINELIGLRNILLPKLMSGQVRVKI
jgi:type I restriction enzyme S subunit